MVKQIPPRVIAILWSSRELLFILLYSYNSTYKINSGSFISHHRTQAPLGPSHHGSMLAWCDHMYDLMCDLLCKCLYHRCWNMSSFVQTGPAWISLSSHGAKISSKYIEKHKLLENERQTRFVLKTCYLGIFPGASTDAGSVTWTSLSCTTTSAIIIIIIINHHNETKMSV